MTTKNYTTSIRENLAEILKRHETLRKLYNRLFDSQRYRQFEVTDWVQQGLSLQKQENLGTINFEHNKVWVQIDNDLEIAYLTEVSGAGLDPEIYQGKYEPENTQLLSQKLKPGGTFIDIGANIGWFSLHAAKIHKEIQIHAFEPGEFIRGYLQANIQRNHLGDRITIHPIALSNKNGSAHFTSNQHGHALNHLQSKSEPDSSPLLNEIQTLTLDRFVEQHDIKNIDFIKCDVEGAELLVLRGARKTLETLHPPLLLEVSPRWSKRYGLTLNELEQFMNSVKYEMRTLNAAGQWQSVTDLATAVGMGADVFCTHKGSAH